MAAHRAVYQLMNIHRLAYFAASRAMLTCLCCAALAAQAASTVPASVAQAMTAGALPSNAVSFVVVDPDSGRVLMSHNPDTPRSPASTIKTVTTFAALDMLGPTFTWQTRAWSHGKDLILQGGGDPYITLERWWSFVQRLRNTEPRSIAGDIIVDNTAFSLPPEDPGAFDGRPNRTYNVVPDALLVNFQAVEFRLSADAESRQVELMA
ncbi:MAG TPA: D-alanyl-D-alanine carboxypeptidase, partial [Steroidobacteraceae bacterium]